MLFRGKFRLAFAMAAMLILPLSLLAGPAALLFTQSKGFEHDVVHRPSPDELSFVESQLKTVLADQKIDLTTSKDPAIFTAANLAKFQTVIFYTTGEIPFTDASKAALLSFIKNGGGFVGIHSATDTNYTWPEYGQLIGARFDGHPWHQKVTINVTAPDHPAMKKLAPNFQINDEIYQFRDFISDGTNVLMTLDLSSVDPTRGKNATGPYPLAWTRTYGQGKVFYTALGHEKDVWTDERFLTHLTNGIESTIAVQSTQIPLPPAAWAGGAMLFALASVQFYKRWKSSMRRPN